jgi:signal peptidase I
VAIDDGPQPAPPLAAPGGGFSTGGSGSGPGGPPSDTTTTDDPAADGPGTTPASRHRRRVRVAIEWVVILGIAVSAALLIRSFVLQPYFIPSGSMEPTLMVGDRVLVNKLSYDMHAVHRGDIVVFSKPPNDVSPGIKDLIKRVIGLPGETISTRNGEVYINGQELSEPWLPKDQVPVPSGPSCVLSTMTIPAGEYYVMGDNRGNSEDSRCFGAIAKKLIIGRAFIKVWPISRIGTL